MRQNLDYIIFDADDTLWINETFFRETEQKLCKLLEKYSQADEVMRVLYLKEIKYLEI